MVPVLTGIAGLVLGFAAGFLYRKSIAASNAQSIEARAQTMRLEAEREASLAATRSLDEARAEIATMRREADEDIRARREEVARQERRMSETEGDLKAKLRRVDAREVELHERDEKLAYVREPAREGDRAPQGAAGADRRADVDGSPRPDDGPGRRRGEAGRDEPGS